MNENQDDHISHDVAPQSEDKKRYTRPILEQYGDIRDLTLGTSMGNRESGGIFPNTKRP